MSLVVLYLTCVSASEVLSTPALHYLISIVLC